MSPPTLLLGLIISILYGSLFHLWRGGGPGRLLYYLVLSVLGFWVGHFLASHFALSFDTLGEIHLGSASIGSLVFLLVGYWLVPGRQIKG
jgi:uncharacterized membrane protein YeaQ/YmgE (transglycosylase-associated protein family)